MPNDPELLDELRNVRLNEPSPGVFRPDHDRLRHDDRAVALALAASLLAERGVTSGARTWSSFRQAGPTFRRRADVEAHEALGRQFLERGISSSQLLPAAGIPHEAAPRPERRPLPLARTPGMAKRFPTPRLSDGA